MSTAPKPESVPTVFNIHEAKTHLSRILLRVQNGETITIAKAGEPIAQLVPLVHMPTPKRVPGAFKGWVKCAPDAFDMTDEIADLFEGGD